MRRFLITSCITLSLVMGAVGVAPIAQAASTTSAAPASTSAAPAAQAQSSASASAQTPPPGSGVPVINSQKDSFSGFGTVMTWIASLFAWLVGTAALTLDYAVYYTVVTMGNYVSHLTAVGVVWRIMRDLGNIFLIFGFLFAGIMTILNVDFYGFGKKMLPMLIVAAIFLNFSLFISEAVIDVGNLFATQFYTQINGGSLPTPTSLVNTTASTEGISNAIMSQLGLSTLYPTNNPAAFTGDHAWLIGFLSIILFLVTAFVMFSLAFILIARFVTLIFLIMISPVAFAGYAIPALSGKSKEWWSMLFKQTITAPVLLLLLYVALAVITDAHFLTGFNTSSGGWLGFVDENNLSGFASILLSFLVAMGLLLYITIKAKDLGAMGADWAMKEGGRASFGAVSLAGRATFGMGGNLLASKRMKSWAEKRGGVGGAALKLAVLGGKGLQSSTYDFRNAPGVATGLKSAGVDAGKGATFTAKQAHEAQYGWKPTKEWLAHSKEDRQQAEREMDFKDAQSVITKAKADLGTGNINQAQYDAIVAPHEKIITSTLSKMSTKQLEELGGIKKATNTLVSNLSPQQFDSLMKSDKLSDTEKANIKNVRFSALATAVSTPGMPQVRNTAIKKALNSLSKGELEALPANMLTDHRILANLSEKQRETLAGSDKLTAADKDKVRSWSPAGELEEVFNDASLGGPAAAATMLGNLTAPQIVKLDKNILLSPMIAAQLAPAALSKIAEENKLSPADMQRIGTLIAGNPTSLGHGYVNSPAGILWK